MSVTFRIHRRFRDFDDLAETVRAWHLDLEQLDRGAFDGEVFQAGSRAAQFAYARFGRLLSQWGTPPTGLRTLVVPARPDLRLRWRGHDVTGDDVMVFPSGGELSASSRPGFEVFTLSFSDELLESTAATGANASAARTLDGVEVLRCDRKQMTALRRAAKRVHAQLAEGDGASGVESLEQDLPVRLMSALAAARGSAGRAVARRERQRAVARALAFVAAHEDEPLTVRDLCAALDVHERTLRRSFVDEFGVAPKAYLFARRLVAVRRDLRRDAGVAIGDVARYWGFWHMGQFAADYRRHFGELPSETRARAAYRSGLTVD